MGDIRTQITDEVQKAALNVIKGHTPELKNEILAGVKDSLNDYAKNEEVGTLRARMMELQDKLDAVEKSAPPIIATKSDAEIGVEGMRDLWKKAKEGREASMELDIQKNHADIKKATGLTGSGLNLGSPRPVADTFRLLRAPSGVAQAFTDTPVGSANLVIPTLVSSDGSDMGRPNHGFARGYAYAYDQGNQTVMERTLNWVRVQASTPVGEDVMNDNPMIEQVFRDDLMAAAARFRATMLANDDGTGTGNAQQIRGLFNGGASAVPSGTSAAVNPVTGVVTIDRVDFPGATLATALAGGVVNNPNSAAGTAFQYTGANATYQQLISAYYMLEPEYREDLCWVFSHEAMQQIRGLVDAVGRPLFTETRMMDEPAYMGTLFGIPVYEDWYAPNFSAGNRVRFGVLGSRSRFYRIYTRMNPELTVTPITNLGYSTYFIRYRLNTLIYDWLAGVALEFVGA